MTHDSNVAPHNHGPQQQGSWSLAGNLDSRSESIREEFPGITIWSIGDESHQSGQSDHNKDSRSIVHAIDVMTYSDQAKGNAVRDWCLEDTADLEYVIYDHKIYSRSSDFAPRDYSGSDPHVDHVHVSGKHGNTGYSSATGTGYDTAAEAMRPAGFEGDDMNEGQAEQLKNIDWSVARGAPMPDNPEGNYAITYWAGDVNETLASLVATVNALAEQIGTTTRAQVSTRRAEQARRLDESRRALGN